MEPRLKLHTDLTIARQTGCLMTEYILEVRESTRR